MILCSFLYRYGVILLYILLKSIKKICKSTKKRGGLFKSAFDKSEMMIVLQWNCNGQERNVKGGAGNSVQSNENTLSK